LPRDGFVLAVPLPPPFAGPEVASEALAAAARDRWGERVHVLNVTVSKDNAEKGLFSSRKVIQLAGLVPRLARQAAHRRVVYLHLAQNVAGLSRDLVLIATARAAGARVVAHLHGGRFADIDLPSWLLAALRRLLRDQVGIALSESLVRHVVHAMPQAEAIVVVPNGVPIPADVSPPPFSLDPSCPLRVAYISTVMRNKGYRELISATAAVNDGIERVELDVFGPTQLDEDVRWIRGAEARYAWLSYHGAVPHNQVPSLIASSDLVALVPKWSEGAPLCILEAMAGGRGVIVSESGALPEMVGPAGWVAEPTVAGVEASLREALADPAALAARAEALRERCRRHYSIDRSVNGVLGLLEQVEHRIAVNAPSSKVDSSDA
jgi:glycosyltransferase involved in cell wall biosynthesis